MSNRHKDEGRIAYEVGAVRADNPYGVGTNDWTDWKDGFDQAEAGREQEAFRLHAAERMSQAG